MNRLGATPDAEGLAVDCRPERMSMAEYAHVQSLQGIAVQRLGSTYWRRSRGFFYRPLLAYEALDGDRATAPCRLFGCYQHVVGDGEAANSTINFRVFSSSGSYSLASQDREYRRMVRIAAKNFSIYPVTQRDLRESGHQLYVQFHERTQYRYMSQRVRHEYFKKWVESLFASEKTIVLGAYGEGGLKAVAVCYWIGSSVLYSTFFSDTAALRQHVSDLMLHAVRQLAGREDGVERILAGMYSGGIGSDMFDLLRGAKVERRRARYVMCPAPIGLVMKTFSPGAFRRLEGNF
jgi:hypothetical protein